MTKLMPRQPVPPLEVATLGGGRWLLAEQTPKHFTMIVFYRGLHCPICSNYIRDLDRKLAEFEALGLSVIAISSDSEERARQSEESWGLETVTIGYGLDLDVARVWGLYISSSRGKTSVGIEEPPLFSEPGLFLVRPDGTLYAASVNTMPFARPHFAEVLKALEMIIEKDYPARGEVT
jgi:peroxiredoxin